MILELLRQCGIFHVFRFKKQQSAARHVASLEYYLESELIYDFVFAKHSSVTKKFKTETTADVDKYSYTNLINT